MQLTFEGILLNKAPNESFTPFNHETQSITKDRDLDKAVLQVAEGSFRNSSQRLHAVKRILVHDKIKEGLC